MNNSFLHTGILFSFLSFFTVAGPDPFETILLKLSEFKATHPQEKIHCHFDKPFYVQTDTIYVKAYLVNAEKNEPVSKSQVMYVELIDAHNKLIKKYLLKVDNGYAYASIPLHELEPDQFYRFRAYTAWMKNFSSEFFYDRTIFVGDAWSATKASTEVAEVKVKTTISHLAKAGFFPEGGQMISGLPSTIGFKITDSITGLGIGVVGKLLDEKGSIVTVFKTDFAGMGRLSFTPFPGHQYTAVLTFEDQSARKFQLPAAKAEGLVLSIDNSDENYIGIRIAGNQQNMSNDYYLVAQSNHVQQFIAKNNTGQSGIYARLLKKRFPDGILQFTLFNALFQPVAERLIFINNNDKINVSMEGVDGPAFRRGKMSLQLTARDSSKQPVYGSFSVTVTSENLLYTDSNSERTIQTELLLQSDLRGHIEQPAKYFSDTTKQTRIALDNLLLTQGWRRFTWNELLAGKYNKRLMPAQDQLALSGQVLDKEGRPNPHAYVQLIITGNNGYRTDTLADGNGHFSFTDFPLTDSLSFMLEARTAAGGKSLLVKIDSLPATVIDENPHYPETILYTDSIINKYKINRVVQMQSSKQFGAFSKDGKMLKEVIVTGRKKSIVEEAVEPSANLNGPGKADQILTYEDFTHCHSLGACLQGKLRGVFLISLLDEARGEAQVAVSSYSQKRPMLVIRDGIEMTSITESDLKGINAADVQSVEVLRSPALISNYGQRGINGVLVITTKRGGIDYAAKTRRADPAFKNMVMQSMQGYYSGRDFYSPDEQQIANKNIPDNRSTVYWNPNLYADEKGNIKLEYFNSDLPGRYKIVLEGLSEEGKIARNCWYYEVK